MSRAPPCSAVRTAVSDEAAFSCGAGVLTHDADKIPAITVGPSPRYFMVSSLNGRPPEPIQRLPCQTRDGLRLTLFARGRAECSDSAQRLERLRRWIQNEGSGCADGASACRDRLLGFEQHTRTLVLGDEALVFRHRPRGGAL